MSAQHDPGLQPQRTSLAWGRTALSMTVVALLVLRAGIQNHQPAVLAVGVLDLVCAILLYVTGTWRRAGLIRDEIHQAPAAWMAGIATAVGLACVAGTWLVLR